MLKLKYLFENYDLAKEALKNWDYDKDTTDGLLSQFRISSNAIYPFCQNGKRCYLRLAPTEEKLEKNILGELEFISFLLANGYSVLKPLKAKDGKLCQKLSTEWGEYYASAFSGVNGVPVEDTDFSGEIMYEYGKALGRLHSLSSRFEPEVRKWTYREALDWAVTVLKEYSAPDFMTEEAGELAKKLADLPTDKDTYGLVHYDFEPDNVFYDETTKVCSVIDFDDGMYHWYALDIEQVFDSLSGELSGEALCAAEKEFIKGYKEEHCYTEEMEASRPLMRRFVTLFGYARLIRSVAETFEDEPEWLVKLRKKLDKVILEKEEAVKKERVL